MNNEVKAFTEAVTGIADGLGIGTTGTAISTNASRVPVSKLSAACVEHQYGCETWEQLALLTGPAPDMRRNAEKFLIRRPKELQDIYQARVADFTYSNLLGNGLGWYVAKLFKDDVQIDAQENGEPVDTSDDTTAEYYGRFLRDCNMAGGSFTEQMQEAFRQLCTFGKSYVLLDLDPTMAGADNLADQRIEPYLCLFEPRSVINFSQDPYGNLNWIVFYDESTAAQFLGDPVVVKRWSYYDRQAFRIYEWRSTDQRLTGETEDHATLKSTGRHALADYAAIQGQAPGMVPVVVTELPEILWLGGRVYLQVCDHINTENTLKWGIFLGNLAMPVIKTKGDYKPQMHEAGAIQLEPGDEFGYAEPSGKTFVIAQDRLDVLREEIYRSMYLQAQGRSSAATPAAQSGISKEQDMAPAREVLNSFGNIMRRHMMTILTLVAAIRQEPQYTFEIRGLQYNDDPITDDITDTQLVMSLGIQSDRFHKEIQKSVARKYGRANSWDSMTIDEVCREIEKADTKSEMDQSQQDREDQQMQKKMSTNVKLVMDDGTGDDSNEGTAGAK